MDTKNDMMSVLWVDHKKGLFCLKNSSNETFIKHKKQITDCYTRRHLKKGQILPYSMDECEGEWALL